MNKLHGGVDCMQQMPVALNALPRRLRLVSSLGTIRRNLKAQFQTLLDDHDPRARKSASLKSGDVATYDDAI